MRKVATLLGALVLLGSAAGTAGAQAIGPKDPGVRTRTAAAMPGYTLVAPFEQQYTYLVDLDGRVAKTWRTSSRPGLSQTLTTDGTLVRAGNLERRGTFATGQGAGGRIEAIAWDGTPLWQHDIATDTEMQHHEIEVMPNGHVLALVWELKSAEEAIAAGRDPKSLTEDELWPDKVVEYDPATDAVVWEWHAWDHLVQDRDPAKPNYAKDVSTRPERIDINYLLNGDNGQADWNHLNAINYNPERDEIVLSSRSFSEIMVLDHATTAEEARGPAGDLQFRYGNPVAYGDTKAKRQLFFQHDAEWIDPGLPGEGNILVFNNGAPKIREFSSADEITPKLDADGNYVRDPSGGWKAKITRVYPKGSEGEFGAIVSSVQRLPNGNTVLAYGPHGHVVEVTPAGKVAWDYVNPYSAIRPTSPRNSGAGYPIQPNWFFQVERFGLDELPISAHADELAPPPKQG
jgi:Arylsulfotransferase (ASST)